MEALLLFPSGYHADPGDLMHPECLTPNGFAFSAPHPFFRSVSQNTEARDNQALSIFSERGQQWLSNKSVFTQEINHSWSYGDGYFIFYCILA